MGKHEYKFNGGQYLTRIGSSWLVSYMYYLKIDKNHKNWGNVSNPSDRMKKFNKCSQFHMKWLQEIVNMNPSVVTEKLDFYFKWLPLSNQNSFDYFKQNLMSNEKLKNRKKSRN